MPLRTFKDFISTTLVNLIAEDPEVLVFVDRDWKIGIWNRGAEAVLGYSAKQACGKSLDFLWANQVPHKKWQQYKVAVKSGTARKESRAFHLNVINESRQTTDVTITFSLSRNEDRQIQGVLMRCKRRRGLAQVSRRLANAAFRTQVSPD